MKLKKINYKPCEFQDQLLQLHDLYSFMLTVVATATVLKQ